MYSTYVTHLEKDSLSFIDSIFQHLDIPKPEVTYLIQVSKEEIKKRLKKRNNDIDNRLNIDSLYENYYHPFKENCGLLEVLQNEIPEDLDKNLKIISQKIKDLKEKLPTREKA